MNLAKYEGKKILIVNIATTGKYTDQLSELEKLYNKYEDDLFVVAFASGSFGNEPHTNESLSIFIEDSLGIHYPVVEISDVTGENAHPVYKWLASSGVNGVMNGKTVCDFQKFLLNEEGKIIGVYRDEVSPLDPLITDMLKQGK